jgi:hypothetical protein
LGFSYHGKEPKQRAALEGSVQDELQIIHLEIFVFQNILEFIYFFVFCFDLFIYFFVLLKLAR